ncbi:MAG: peptidase S8 [Flavobacteriaceae bacterium]|nr:peptidase S8 [Flavobacteriaceae bacterium]|tara:strand:+ start:4712 stop:6280 length:1569 start_codon:yes stop_codon:yes gene_type:complete
MKKVIIIFVSACFIGCSAVRFVGNPITVVSNNSKSNDLFSDELKEQWSLLDIKKDSVPGMSVIRAKNELISDQKSNTVTVAIIDSGVDIEHPYLSSHIWINEDEIPNNKIDDDKNGYVDDIHGWNFLGDSNKENMEYVRLLKKSNPKDSMYNVYNDEILKVVNQTNQTIMRIEELSKLLSVSDSIVSLITGKDNYTLEDLDEIQTAPENEQVLMAIDFIKEAKTRNWNAEGFESAINYYKSRLEYHVNVDFDGRKVVGDDPDDINDIDYGDSNVIGLDKDDARHGTHVSGIVVSIADNVKIMPIRCVPDGDEYDKDVALAIRYAVDNGADIINFSFGKSYSPHPDWVNSAMEYASENDVLIVNAAGNDAKDIDSDSHKSYPSDNNSGVEFIDNLITVGASTFNYTENQIANFSNYGVKNVDVFAPGFQVYSSIPNGEFAYLNGTSMASPNAAGVAAVLRSYYPKLSASTIKKIIINSGVMMHHSINKPRTEDVIGPKAISKSGKTVNLYNALLLASLTKNGK